jgi:Tol biopolymer transport system component
MAGDISMDGKRVTYSVIKPSSSEGFVIPFDGGTAEKLCDDCIIRDGSERAGFVFFSRGVGTYLLDLKTRTERKVVPRIAPVRSSPDGRWFAAYSAEPAGVFVTRMFPDRESSIADVIPITKAATGDYLTAVSPDGSTIYFMSPRDGFHCLWAQKVDPGTVKLIGAPYAVYHAHSARWSTAFVGGGLRRLGAARNKVVFTMAERTGNIWMADLTGGK